MDYPVKLNDEFRYQGEQFVKGDIFNCPTEHMQTYMFTNGVGSKTKGPFKPCEYGSRKLTPSRNGAKKGGRYGTRQLKAEIEPGSVPQETDDGSAAED